jgi:hypothetical protein
MRFIIPHRSLRSLGVSGVSFIRRKRNELLRKGIGIQQELRSFIWLVTLYALLINIFAGSLLALLQYWTKPWVDMHPALAGWITFALFLLATCAGGALLIAARTSVLEEVRRFSIVLPVMAFADRLEVIEIEGYGFSGSIKRRLAQVNPQELLNTYRTALHDNPGRPFQGRLYRAISDALVAELALSLAGRCKFLLSADAEFHGVDYSGLASSPGPCTPVETVGLPDLSIHLPTGCRVAVKPLPPDRFSKVTNEIRIDGPYGPVRFWTWSQWAILSEGYHGRSFDLAKSLLKTAVKNYSDRNPGRPPALWMLEVPAEARVHFNVWRRPWLIASKRFELYVSWIDDLLELVEEDWSWELFVERCSEPFVLPRSKL